MAPRILDSGWQFLDLVLDLRASSQHAFVFLPLLLDFHHLVLVVRRHRHVLVDLVQLAVLLVLSYFWQLFLVRKRWHLDVVQILVIAQTYI